MKDQQGKAWASPEEQAGGQGRQLIVQKIPKHRFIIWTACSLLNERRKPCSVITGMAAQQPPEPLLNEYRTRCSTGGRFSNMRIIEHKWFEFGKDENGNDLPKTVISHEYSSGLKPGEEPYYPEKKEKTASYILNTRIRLNKRRIWSSASDVVSRKYYDIRSSLRL